MEDTAFDFLHDAPMTVTAAASQQPEIVSLTADQIGSHAQHWTSAGLSDLDDLPQWLIRALEGESLRPLGLDQGQSSAVWVVVNEAVLQVAQVIQLEDGTPSRIVSAYPCLESNYQRQGKVRRILACDEQQEAVLEIELDDGTMIFAFDVLYPINAEHYQADQTYRIHLGAIAYELELAPAQDILDITDPAAIRHHRALNAVLRQHPDTEPDDLHQAIHDWQPSSPDDTAPLQINLGSMVAYLHGDVFGQQDEAWIQGEILGAQSIQMLDGQGQLLDILIQREEVESGLKPFVIQVAYCHQGQPLVPGQKVRGNVWLQATIYGDSAR